MDWLRIEFHDFFYEVIMTSWPGSRVWKINPGWHHPFFRSFFFYTCVPFQFHPLTLNFFKIRLHDFHCFPFNRVIIVLWLRSYVWLARVDQNLFLGHFFKIEYFFCFILWYFVGLRIGHRNLFYLFFGVILASWHMSRPIYLLLSFFLKNSIMSFSIWLSRNRVL